MCVLLASMSVGLAPRLARGQGMLPDSVVSRIDAIFGGYTPYVPGCAVGVYQDGRVAFAKGYGSANVEYDIPLTGTTPMIMGSVSKQFTAAAIALLVEQKRISLSDDIRKYIPELTNFGKAVTIDELVHHTSGIRDFWTLVELAGMRPDDGYTVDDILAIATRQRHLNFEPGSEYAYSNTGYVLLGIVVRRVSGKSLREFAAEQIFGPLGMTGSQFHDDHNQPVHGRAFAYQPRAGGGYAIDIWNNDIVGQGGLMTTVEDLQKWDENFYTGRVGGRAFLAQQLDQGVLNDGRKLAYAFGLEIGSYRGLPMVEHSGTTGGYRTDITRFPSVHTSVVTMCNVSTANSVALAHQTADAVLGDRFPQGVASARVQRAAAQQASSGITLSAADVRGMAGRYFSPELQATYELEARGAMLILHRPRAAADTLHAVDRATLRGKGVTLHWSPPDTPRAAFTLESGRVRGIEFARAASGSK
jgi:CubicO group peptidase (beta-lactamase class C family)